MAPKGLLHRIGRTNHADTGCGHFMRTRNADISCGHKMRTFFAENGKWPLLDSPKSAYSCKNVILGVPKSVIFGPDGRTDGRDGPTHIGFFGLSYAKAPSGQKGPSAEIHVLRQRWWILITLGAAGMIALFWHSGGILGPDSLRLWTTGCVLEYDDKHFGLVHLIDLGRGEIRMPWKWSPITSLMPNHHGGHICIVLEP